MRHPTLGRRASFGGESRGSRVMAAQFASGEEQLCEKSEVFSRSFLIMLAVMNFSAAIRFVWFVRVQSGGQRQVC